MSDTHPQATDPTTSEPSRWDLLEIDAPEAPEPTLPAWAATVITAIAGILPAIIGADAAFEALRALCAPLAARPECPGKAAVRVAKDAKLAEINALRASVPHTVRQAIPTPAPAPVAAHATPSELAQGTPVLGSYSKIRTGRHRDSWGARFQGCRAPVVGDVALVARRNGATQAKLVTSVVWSGVGDDNRPAHVVSIEDAPDGAPVTLRHQMRDTLPGAYVTPAGARLADPDPTVAPVYTAPEHEAPAVNSELATEDLGLAQSLAAAQGESAHNAATQAAGSLADGSMRGVGFSTAAGYVTALANGVKRATADGYLATLRTSYGYTADQLAALTVTIIPEAAPLPNGPGIKHTPTGPSIFDLPASQRTFRVGSQPSTQAGRATMREAKASVRDTLKQSGLIAGLMTERALLQWSWVGGGERKREAFVQAFETHGISTDLVPPAPSAERSCGHAVEALRGRDFDTKRLSNAGLPEGVRARWQVGRALTGGAVTAGAAYGEILLVVDLHDDGSLAFDGDAGLASSVRARYNAITGGEILKSDVLTAWLGKLLSSRFYAVKDGAAYYVPAGEREAARALCNVLREIGWGSHRAINVTDETDVASVLGDGLRAALARVSGLVTDAITDARERARVKAEKDGRDPELMMRRATLSTQKAASLIREVATIAARISGYEGAMGEDAARELRQSLIVVQRALEGVAGDETTGRAAMLELD